MGAVEAVRLFGAFSKNVRSRGGEGEAAFWGITTRQVTGGGKETENLWHESRENGTLEFRGGKVFSRGENFCQQFLVILSVPISLKELRGKVVDDISSWGGLYNLGN